MTLWLLTGRTYGKAYYLLRLPMAGHLARLLTKTLHHLAYGLFEDVLGSLIFLVESLQNLTKSLEILHSL